MCNGLFIDVGANEGDTLRRWFEFKSCSEPHPGDTDCMWTMPAYLPLSVRQTFCAASFEANPRHGPRLSKVAARVIRRHRTNVSVHVGTAFALHNGTVMFGVDNSTARSLGSSLAATKRMLGRGGKPNRGPPVASNAISVHAVDAVRYLQGLSVNRIALKVDVEAFEYELLRDLIATGVLCQKVEDLFVEWHEDRIAWRAEGLPVPGPALRAAYTWMLGNATRRRCRTRLHKWV